MKKLFPYISIVLLFSFAELFCQEIKTPAQKNRDLKVIGVTETPFLENQNEQSLQQLEINQQLFQEGSSVNLIQIGDFNFSNINTTSNDVTLSLNQTGTNNYINIDKSANKISQSVIQKGNNNFIQDQSIYTNTTILNKFTQLGDNLSLYNFGSNSISATMSVLQIGNQRSVIIINK
ncbi:hypothetical protein [Flavobacterium sp.]|uniref:hypothetical protein n=1 Tax=Flavobacterium sp. TaxID=239 RepID=UPI00286DCEE9|nr:hypothetical protein [Flavobacterium sp.]